MNFNFSQKSIHSKIVIINKLEKIKVWENFFLHLGKIARKHILSYNRSKVTKITMNEIETKLNRVESKCRCYLQDLRYLHQF